jgi:hypothetical protein
VFGQPIRVKLGQAGEALGNWACLGLGGEDGTGWFGKDVELSRKKLLLLIECKGEGAVIQYDIHNSGRVEMVKLPTM